MKLLIVWFLAGILEVPFSRGDQPRWRAGYSYPKPLPQEIMVDAVNYIGLVLLQAHNQNNENNIALSPYGATSVLVALGEGVQGTALDEILRASLLPLDVSVTRVGLRDIHRHLKSYFIPQEGFLAGLTFSHENVTLKPSYEDILKFYGYDVDSFNNALYPDPYTSTTAEATSSSSSSNSASFSSSVSTTPMTIMTPTTMENRDKFTASESTTEPSTVITSTVMETDTKPPETTAAPTINSPITDETSGTTLLTTTQGMTTNKVQPTTSPSSFTSTSSTFTTKLISTVKQRSTTNQIITTTTNIPITTTSPDTETQPIITTVQATTTTTNPPTTTTQATTVTQSLTTTTQPTTTTLSTPDTTTIQDTTENKPTSTTTNQPTTVTQSTTTTNPPTTTSQTTIVTTTNEQTPTTQATTTTNQPTTTTQATTTTQSTTTTTNQTPTTTQSTTTTTNQPTTTTQATTTTQSTTTTTTQPTTTIQATTPTQSATTTTTPLTTTTQSATTTTNPPTPTTQSTTTTTIQTTTPTQSATTTTNPLTTTTRSATTTTTSQPTITTQAPAIAEALITTTVRPITTTTVQTTTSSNPITTSLSSATISTTQPSTTTTTQTTSGSDFTTSAATTDTSEATTTTTIQTTSGSDSTTSAATTDTSEATTTTTTTQTTSGSDSTTSAATTDTSEPTRPSMVTIDVRNADGSIGVNFQPTTIFSTSSSEAASLSTVDTTTTSSGSLATGNTETTTLPSSTENYLTTIISSSNDQDSGITISITASTIGTNTESSTTEEPISVNLLTGSTGFELDVNPTTIRPRSADIVSAENTTPRDIKATTRATPKKKSIPRFRDDAELVNLLKSENKSATVQKIGGRNFVRQITSTLNSLNLDKKVYTNSRRPETLTSTEDVEEIRLLNNVPALDYNYSTDDYSDNIQSTTKSDEDFSIIAETDSSIRDIKIREDEYFALVGKEGTRQSAYSSLSEESSVSEESTLEETSFPLASKTERNRNRPVRSIVDYLIARYHDNNAPPYMGAGYEPLKPTTFAVNGKIREPNISFMTYDTVLPFRYISYLNALALTFPLDSTKYYLLLLLPVDDMGIDNLINNLMSTTLKQIIYDLQPTRVKATIPSFMLKGYVVLTPTLQKMGIRQIFEPRHADFSRMTDDKDIYVTNIEQAITVTIRNYVDPATLQNNQHFLRRGPVQFTADHPFLYFVMDSSIHVSLMAGKIINPLNSRIR